MWPPKSLSQETGGANQKLPEPHRGTRFKGDFGVQAPGKWGDQDGRGVERDGKHGVRECPGTGNV